MATHAPKSSRTSARSSVSSLGSSPAESRLVQLQRTIGNRATTKLLQGSSDTIQTARKKKKKKGKKARSRNKKKQMAQVVQQAEKSGGLLQWLASFVRGASYEAAKDDEDDEPDPLVSFEDVEKEEEGENNVGYEDEFGKEEEDEDDSNVGEQLQNPFAIKYLEINLVQGSGETDTRMGKASGKGKTSLNDNGVKMSGEGSLEGRYGKGQAEGHLQSGDKHEGQGKVEFLLGMNDERKSGTLSWGMSGQEVAGSGEMESKVGLSGKLAAKMLYDSLSGDMSAKGKAGAFLGASTEGKVNIKFKSNGQDLGTSEGKLGLSVGLGGEIGGGITWQGGTLEFSSHGKLVAGLGFSYGYKFSLNTNALAKAVPGWGSWMMSQVSWMKFW